MNISIRRYWNLLPSYLKPQWPRVALLALVLLASIGLELLNPQILRSFIDAATAQGPQDELMGTALLFIGVALLHQLLSVAATYFSENVGWTATNALRADLAAHCLRLDLSFHKARTPGELIERVDGDVNVLSNFFSQFIIHMLSNLILLVGVLALLFREDWRAGLGLSAFALIALATLIGIRSVAVPYWAAQREASAGFFGFLGEQLAGTEDIRSSGATGYVMRRFYELLRCWLPIQRKAGLAGYSMWMTTLFVFALGNAVAFAVGDYLHPAGAITIGTFYIIFYYTELLRRPIEQIRTQMQDLQKAGASIVRVEELFRTEPRIKDGPGDPIPPGPLPVAFESVSFGYADSVVRRPLSVAEESNNGQRTTDNGQRTLHDITFHLEPGKVLGLLGRTGSGKTTLARLLLRLYDPTEGAICLGGVDARAARLDVLRRRVGVVTQDVQLFHATVRENLTFFDRALPDERILSALDDLGLRPWLESLPDGLDTELEAGSGLSAGEGQLLAFARLFLTDPGLVILDEASSRLDPATEQLIERAVDKLLRPVGGRRTAIIIAHRLATVQRADEIMILDGGRIVEHGERARLAADPDSRFSQLLRTGMEEVLA